MTNTFLPPEWVPQSGVMLTWPHQDTIWAETLAEIDAVMCQIAKEISLREKVVISCFDETDQKRLYTLLKNNNVNLNQISIYIAPCDDIWVRDHGPITVLDQHKPILLDFEFNGWGKKYPHANDNLITQSIHQANAFGRTPLQTISMVLEGGSIEVDGQGTLLTTSSCLLAPSRNPQFTKSEIVTTLKEYFSVDHILWLDHGHLSGDDTDGHIDTLARFVNPETICYITCDDPSDEHYDDLKQMEQQLKTFRNRENKTYQLIPLPWPKARYADYDGRRLPLSYANFLIINDAVLAPTYDDPADQEALENIQKCFPDREIIAIPSLPIVQWYGSIHCMTMQLPLGVLS